MSKTTVRPTQARSENYREVDDKAALGLLMDLLPVPGLSGQENEITEFIRGKLRQAGVPADAIVTDDAHKRSPLGGQNGNLICQFPGTARGKRRLLMAHMDTVPLCAGTRPVLSGGYIRSGNPKTGLGGDNRSGIGAILNAALTILKHKLPHPPLTFFFPVQEEVGLFGVRFARLALLGQPKLCFNWDGNRPNCMVVGATGAYRMNITVRGLASHAGVAPEKGVSAIAIAGMAIHELQSNGWHGLVSKNGKRGTSNIGVINGGNATNVVADEVLLRAEARSHDPRFRRQIVTAYERAFARAVKQLKSIDGRRGQTEIKADLHYESFRLAENNESVAAARQAIEALGMKAESKISNGGLDANWLTERGLPTVTLGAGQQDVHTLNEKLQVDSYLMGCRAALALATAAM